MHLDSSGIVAPSELKQNVLHLRRERKEEGEREKEGRDGVRDGWRDG